MHKINRIMATRWICSCRYRWMQHPNRHMLNPSRLH